MGHTHTHTIKYINQSFEKIQELLIRSYRFATAFIHQFIQWFRFQCGTKIPVMDAQDTDVNQWNLLVKFFLFFLSSFRSPYSIARMLSLDVEIGGVVKIRMKFFCVFCGLQRHRPTNEQKNTVSLLWVSIWKWREKMQKFFASFSLFWTCRSIERGIGYYWTIEHTLLSFITWISGVFKANHTRAMVMRIIIIITRDEKRSKQKQQPKQLSDTDRCGRLKKET